MIRFVRAHPEGRGPCLGQVLGDTVESGTVEGTVELLDHDDPLAAIRGEGKVVGREQLGRLRLLAPIEAPEIWCAGVTYECSRDARLE